MHFHWYLLTTLAAKIGYKKYPSHVGEKYKQIHRTAVIAFEVEGNSINKLKLHFLSWLLCTRFSFHILNRKMRSSLHRREYIANRLTNRVNTFTHCSGASTYNNSLHNLVSASINYAFGMQTCTLRTQHSLCKIIVNALMNCFTWRVLHTYRQKDSLCLLCHEFQNFPFFLVWGCFSYRFYIWYEKRSRCACSIKNVRWPECIEEKISHERSRGWKWHSLCCRNTNTHTFMFLRRIYTSALLLLLFAHLSICDQVALNLNCWIWEALQKRQNILTFSYLINSSPHQCSRHARRKLNF